MKRLSAVCKLPQEEIKAAMESQGIDRPDIYSNTMLLADTVEDYGIQEGLDLLPVQYKSPDKELKKIAYEGLEQRGFADNPEYITRVEEELQIIKDKKFDFELLRKYTKVLAKNLDIVIDKNYYPTPECRASNMKHRPIGVGVQGLADVFAILRLPWTSKEARNLNREIFENMYFAALEASMERCVELGTYGHLGLFDSAQHSSFLQSPLYEGKFQFDLWHDRPTFTSSYLNWDKLRKDIMKYGVRNSLSIALMPTASTSQILGNNECFEPFTSNLYTRRVLAGDFMVVNKYLVNDLMKLNLWDDFEN